MLTAALLTLAPTSGAHAQEEEARLLFERHDGQLDGLLGVEVEGAGEFGMDVPMVHVDGFDPSGGLVWFRPTVVRGSDGEVKYCDLRLEIVGCLTDVSEVRTTRLPSGQERSHSVTSADQKISETAQRLLKGQTLSYRVIKVNGEGETVETEVSISCEPRTLSKTGGGV